MVNSISASFIRELCDEIGFRTEIDSNGFISLCLSKDEDFGHDVLVVFSVDNNRLHIFSFARGLEIEQRDVAKTLVKLNKYNAKGYMTAYLSGDGDVMVDRLELLDEEVSESFIKENCIKLCVQVCWNFFKENFAEY